MIGPASQRFANLLGVGGAVVGPGHARLVPRTMVQDGLDDVGPDAKVAEAGGGSAPEVVNCPRRNRTAKVKRSLRRCPRCEATKDGAPRVRPLA